MSHRKLNAIIAGVIFVISFLTYLSTMAPTTSFWDCGEFITCSYILGVPHPPGAPLYILVGRLFSMLPTSEDIGVRVNLISPLVSAFTSMLTYLIIVQLIALWKGQPRNWTTVDRIAIYASGIIGALAFTFSDSQWFNSVEAEVYAGAMFFTAIVVWLILKWMDHAESERSYHYILLIFYIVGLAIGVHLLNILALPSIFLIILLRQQKVKSPWILIGTGILAFIELGFVYLIYKTFGPENIRLGVELFGVDASIYLAISLVGLVLLGLMYMHYSFMKSSTSSESVKQISLIAFFTIGATLALGIIYPGIVKGIPALIDKAGFVVLGLVLAALMFFTILAINKKKLFFALPLMAVVLVTLGYSTYTTLFIRSQLNPAVDENNPDNPDRLVKYLNREQYGDWTLYPRRASFWNYQIEKMYIRYFNWQFLGKGEMLDKEGRIVEAYTLRGLWGLPFLIGLIGMIHHFSRDWRRALSILTLFIATGLMIIIYLNQEDPQPRERDYAYTGSFFVFALWIGIGVTALVDMVKEALGWRHGKSLAKAIRDGGRPQREEGSAPPAIAWALSALVFLAVPLNMFKFNYHEHNRQGNFVAYDYSYNILQSCEPNAIIFTNGDNDTFPLWFLQYVYNIRRDVRVVNLSLLNTDWYIKQLRDDEPRVPIRLTDFQIDGLQAQPWETQTVNIKVPKATYDQYYENLRRLDSTLVREGNPAIRIKVEPTLYGQGIRVQDLMVLKILEDTQFRRPIYFAVTVSPDNKLNLDPYMRMDGLAFKVLPVKINNPRLVDPQIMWTNLNEKFKYRNLNNPEVYYDDNTKSLLGNYRSAFLTLAQHLARFEDQRNLQALSAESRGAEWETNRTRALQVLDRMNEVMPESVIPTDNYAYTMAIGAMYEQLGRPEEFDKRAKAVLIDGSSKTSSSDKIMVLDQYDYYTQTFRHQPAAAESLALKLISGNPDLETGYLWLARHYAGEQQYQRSVEMLERWLKRKPNDQQTQSMLKQIRTLAQADSLAKAGRSTGSASPDTTSRK